MDHGGDTRAHSPNQLAVSVDLRVERNDPAGAEAQLAQCLKLLRRAAEIRSGRVMSAAA
jgi:hypothetical protein